MIKDKVTMQDLLGEHLATLNLQFNDDLSPDLVIATSRDFYAGAAAMAQQFAANGVLTLADPDAREPV